MTEGVAIATVETFGQRLRRLRQNARLDQIALGLKVGVSDAAISQWEHNKRTPRRCYVERMALIFCVTQHYLMFGYEDPMYAESGVASVASDRETVEEWCV